MALTAAADTGPTPQPTGFAGLLPQGIATAEWSGPADPGLLLAGERALLGAAGPERGRQFAAGRVCARRAMARFGHGNLPLGALPDRRPRWPDALTGSITHAGDYAAAAVGERRRYRAIGIDAELIGAVTPDLWPFMFCNAESGWLDGLPRNVQEQAATLLFSAKETFFKCQYEVTGQWLDFHDVVVECPRRDLDGADLAVRSVHRLARLDGPGAVVRYAFRDGRVLTATVLAAH